MPSAMCSWSREGCHAAASVVFAVLSGFVFGMARPATTKKVKLSDCPAGRTEDTPGGSQRGEDRDRHQGKR